jgi:uncharacterized membrane protein YfcA
MDPGLALSGLLVGILVGVTGVGGGSLMTPLLILLFGTNPVVAVGTDLAYGAITKTAGGIAHLRQRTVDLRLSWWMAAGSVPAAVVGVVTLEQFKRTLEGSFSDTLIAAVAGAVLFAGIAVLARPLIARHTGTEERDSVPLESRHKLAAVVVGALVGFVLGITSVGSGALIGVALILLFRLTPHRMVGTDIFHAAVLLYAAAIAHLLYGNIDYGLMGNLLIGSIPGIWVGSHLSTRLPVAALRTALACVLALANKGGWGLSVVSFIACSVPSVLIMMLLIRRRARTVPPPVTEPVSERV